MVEEWRKDGDTWWDIRNRLDHMGIKSADLRSRSASFGELSPSVELVKRWAKRTGIK